MDVVGGPGSSSTCPRTCSLTLSVFHNHPRRLDTAMAVRANDDYLLYSLGTADVPIGTSWMIHCSSRNLGLTAFVFDYRYCMYHFCIFSQPDVLCTCRDILHVCRGGWLKPNIPLQAYKNASTTTTCRNTITCLLYTSPSPRD